LGEVIQPWPYLTRNNVDDTGGGLGVLNLIVSGNQVLRTWAPGQVYSAYGYGVRYARGGPVDPMITPAVLGLGVVNYPSLRITGGGWHSLVSHNIFSTGYDGVVHFMDSVGYGGVRSFVTARVVDNICTNFTGLGLYADCDGRIEEDGNTWDADPFHNHVNRRPGGTWAAASAHPVGVYSSQTAVVLLGSSHYRNLVMPTAAVVGSTIQVVGTPVVYCQPTSLDYASTNTGVAVPSVPGGRFVVEDGDPASATFGRIVSPCPPGATTRPASGYWVQGQRVENLRPTVLGSPGSRYIVSGWVRVTTGANHVVGVDWVDNPVLTGT
jgi:hypothetical protein